MASILVLHGPNLNLLGEREPEIYGSRSLADINQTLQQQAQDAGHHLLAMQSNAEYELVERIQDARHEGVNFIIINPAAFTHSSIAIRDALAAVELVGDGPDVRDAREQVERLLAAARAEARRQAP